MKPKRRKISPHEPDQPIAGIVEAIQDSNEMLRVWAEKKQRASTENLEQQGTNLAQAEKIIGTARASDDKCQRKDSPRSFGRKRRR